MSGAELKTLLGDFWPYAVMLFVGVLPTEIWRVLAVVVAKDLKEDSDLLEWVRLVASALLAGVVAKLAFSPAGLLATVPFWGRILSLATGLAALFLFRRSVVAAVLVGEAVLIASYFAR